MLALYALLATAVAANPLLFPRQSGTKANFVEPPARGNSTASGTQSPCGGVAFDDNKMHHQYWGMNADFYMQVENDVTDVQLSWSKSTDMSGEQVFLALEKATAGSICLDDPISFAELGLSRGDEITVQLQYHDEATKQYMFSCVDLHLTSDHAYDPPSHLDCRNSSFIRVVGEDNSNTEVSNGSGGKKQKVSPVGAGFIGAGVALAVALLALLGLKLGGCLFFSRGAYNRAQRRRTSEPFDDDISLNNSVHKAPMGTNH